MFDNKSLVESYTYSIDLLTPINFICSLAQDIAKINSDNYDISELFEDELLDTVEVNFERIFELSNGTDNEDKSRIDLLSNDLANYYNQNIITDIDAELRASEILLIHRTSKSLYLLNKKNIRNDNTEVTGGITQTLSKKINNVIKEKNLLKNIIERIRDEEVRECLENSIKIEFIELYKDCFKIKLKKNIDVPYAKFSYFNTAMVAKDFIDTESIWINKDKFREELKIDVGVANNINSLNLLGAQNTEIGIVYNDYVFPFVEEKLVKYINEDNKVDYYWLQIKEVFRQRELNKELHKSEILDNFKLKIKKNNLSDLLSYLENNLYVKNDILQNYPQYLEYFESVLKIDNLKYLEDFNFFISQSQNPSTLGIYTDKKIDGETHYNLLHWLSKTENNSFNFRDSFTPRTKETKQVSSLKPEIAFYYIHKYFEDFIQKILDELEAEYISNFHLWYNGSDLGEFDFLIKNGNKLYFIEAKTKLSKENIEAYQSKCAKTMKAFQTFGIEVEFLIVGAYSNQSCESFRYFINRVDKRIKKYNSKRENLKTMPYYFKVPIQEIDKKIVCIAEPHYSKLKELIKKLCQK
ncbi:hypothetical protein [Flavobacterium dankookense]|uniref:Uncharacterized protein n=1 Tax=Flavobacterium dankookense TaxID=706186 RepID=A0A4R6Q9K5_9FLAO|nr:hypothetical protein [Flavobacterium dankookense]TDP58860.1 hypothetical protein BC748_2103 [Flavobacterium dankookense]